MPTGGKRQGEGSWKWIYAGGDAEKFARGEGGDISPFIASCRGKPSGVIQATGQHSPDQTLAWLITPGPRGQRRFRCWRLHRVNAFPRHGGCATAAAHCL